jgi:hypothetical protein
MTMRTVRDLIEELQYYHPDALVGIGTDASHYISKVGRVDVETSTVSVPADAGRGGIPIVTIYVSDESYVPGDEA